MPGESVGQPPREDVVRRGQPSRMATARQARMLPPCRFVPHDLHLPFLTTRFAQGHEGNEAHSSQKWRRSQPPHKATVRQAGTHSREGGNPRGSTWILVSGLSLEHFNYFLSHWLGFFLSFSEARHKQDALEGLSFLTKRC